MSSFTIKNTPFRESHEVPHLEKISDVMGDKMCIDHKARARRVLRDIDGCVKLLCTRRGRFEFGVEGAGTSRCVSSGCRDPGIVNTTE
jgi:hypothetical protein